MLPSSVTGWVHGVWEGRNWKERSEGGVGLWCKVITGFSWRAESAEARMTLQSCLKLGGRARSSYPVSISHWVCAALGEKCFEDRVECVTMDTTFSWILAFGLGGKEGDKLVAGGPWGLQWTVIFNRRSLGVVLVRRRDFMGYCWGRCLQAGCLSEA